MHPDRLLISIQQNISILYNTNNKDLSLTNVSRCEYWSLIKSGGAANPFVAGSWNTNSCGVSSVADLRVVRWDAVMSKWRDMGSSSTSGTVTAGSVLASLNSYQTQNPLSGLN